MFFFFFVFRVEGGGFSVEGLWFVVCGVWFVVCGLGFWVDGDSEAGSYLRLIDFVWKRTSAAGGL